MSNKNHDGRLFASFFCNICHIKCDLLRFEECSLQQVLWAFSCNRILISIYNPKDSINILPPLLLCKSLRSAMYLTAARLQISLQLYSNNNNDEVGKLTISRRHTKSPSEETRCLAWHIRWNCRPAIDDKELWCNLLYLPRRVINCPQPRRVIARLISWCLKINLCFTRMSIVADRPRNKKKMQ